jgi:hypothetical protein
MSKSSNKEQRRLQRNPADFSHVRTGMRVKVFMSAGWAKGVMTERGRGRYVSVKLDGQRRAVAVWDGRNVEPL